MSAAATTNARTGGSRTKRRMVTSLASLAAVALIHPPVGRITLASAFRLGATASSPAGVLRGGTSSSTSTTALLSSSTKETTTTTSTGGSGATEMPSFDSQSSYEKFLESHASLPKGFAAGSASGTFVPVEAPAMGELPIKATVVHLTDGPTDSWYACFTKNKFPGAPIKVGRKRLAAGTPLQALVINNKVSNVCSGGDGEADAELVCDAVAKALDLPGGASSVLPSSTGVIGWNLPATELASDVVPRAVEKMQSESALEAAGAIMTTDRFPKLRSCTLKGGARIVGIAKGAGMIEPNMATMLSYIFTDAKVSRDTLGDLLPKVVDESYNSISVDGDESTSDTVAILSSNRIDLDDDGGKEEFESALGDICRGLASDIVRNGEGTSHVIRVRVENFPGSDYDARRLGRHVVNSPLFKCAVSGNDPNTGRLAGAIGSFVGKMENGIPDEKMADVTLTLGGRVICAGGRFNLEGDEVERELSDHMKDAQFGELDEFPRHQRFVEVGIDFGSAGGGTGSATVLGSDLTAEYVSVNADYRS